MSYEGREISICEKGHLLMVTCGYSLDDPDECHCGSKIVWWRGVDDTNCEAFGDFPLEFFKIKTPEVIDECPTCHHKKLVVEATFEIPKCPECGSEKIASLRYQPGYGGTPFIGSIVCTECRTILFSEPVKE